MFHRSGLLYLKKKTPISCSSWVFTRFTSTETVDPLRILFCGSDEFSKVSLEALHRVCKSEPALIQSIDVVCRPPKRVGRGLKVVREVPISTSAEALGLPLHQIDTFNGWNLPIAADQTRGYINLIIAVSFGLLIPSRIIEQAKYGGLNVHPSKLPDFRGAAPIERALLAGCTNTGVTLQTLHPTKLDHGIILSRSPSSGLDIPRPKSIQPAELKELLAPIGASMLVDAIRNRLYIHPIQALEEPHNGLRIDETRKAPKITPEDRHIRWHEWTAEEILRRSRIIGPLWNNITIGGETLRVTFTGGFSLVDGYAKTSVQPGVPMFCLHGRKTSSAVWIKTVDNKLLCVYSIKTPGHGKQMADAWARKRHLFNTEESESEIEDFGTFALSLSKFE